MMDLGGDGFITESPDRVLRLQRLQKSSGSA